jgi:hypothetical protein
MKLEIGLGSGLRPLRFSIVAATCSDIKFVVFLPSPFGRSVGDEGFCADAFLKLVLRGGRVVFKDKRNLGVVGLSPHPNPLPVGEGDKSRLVRSAS